MYESIIHMAGDKFQIQAQNHVHFITCTIIHWIDLFSRDNYRCILIESLKYCIKHKGLHIHAWVIMSNHIHLICYAEPPFQLSDVIRDFKSFTSKRFIAAIQDIPESRRKWLLNSFAFEAKRSRRKSASRPVWNWEKVFRPKAVFV